MAKDKKKGKVRLFFKKVGEEVKKTWKRFWRNNKDEIIEEIKKEVIDAITKQIEKLVEEKIKKTTTHK